MKRLTAMAMEYNDIVNHMTLLNTVHKNISTWYLDNMTNTEDVVLSFGQTLAKRTHRLLYR